MKAEITYFTGVVSISAAFVIAGNWAGALTVFGIGAIGAALAMTFLGWD